jgi:DNA recombination protein RmuC
MGGLQGFLQSNITYAVYIAAFLVLVAIVLLIIVLVKSSSKGKDFSEIAGVLQEENSEIKEDLQDGLRKSSDAMQQALLNNFAVITGATRQQLGENREEAGRQIKALGTDMEERVRQLQEGNQNSFQKINELLETRVRLLQEENQKSLEKVNVVLESRMKELQESNEKRLEEMRLTVDEKLQKTLEARLSESFKTVSEHLNNVQRGLGEMKTLASDVGGLKRALLNVKNRGTFGEVQLERILEDMLSPGQYDKNVATKKGSYDRVEFALKLPGQDDNDVVYLPIDSKFPREDYERLLDCNENGDKEEVEKARRNLALRIKVFAKDIRDKYIDPPNTTEFAILFVPTEGLYAEIVQNVGLFDSLQRDFRVTVAGPTTISAFLNALQMGFKTLAIEKRSVEVWKVLGAVKTEFLKFEKVLQKTQERIRKADNDLEELVGARSKKMHIRLRQVENLPDAEAARILGDDNIRHRDDETNDDDDDFDDVL